MGLVMLLRWKVVSSVWLACCLAILPAGVAAAEQVDDGSRAAARKLGYSGVEAYQAGDYRTASEKLEKAYRMLGVPSVGLWSARTLVKLGKLVEASERFLEVTRLSVSSGDQAVQKRALTEAASELEALAPRIPSLAVQVEGAAAAEVKVFVDGAPISVDLIGEARPVNPGRHQIEGQRGSERAVIEVTVAEGEQKPALLRFGGAAQPPKNAPAQELAGSSVPDANGAGLGTQRTLALVAGGVGLVGIGVGTVFGLKSKSSHDEAAKFCNGTVCRDPRGVTAGEDAHAAGNVSTVCMLVGALAVGGGVALWFTAPRSNERPSAELALGLGTLHIRGDF